MLNGLAIAPVRVLEGENILTKELVSGYSHVFGGRPALVLEDKIFEKFENEIDTAFSGNIIRLAFNGECSKEEIDRLSVLIETENASSIIGMGGGKVLDIVKDISCNLKLACITIPTSAATCAASSAISALYYPDGAPDHYSLHDKAPELVIIDYNIIITAPLKMLAAGAADSLAKHYESAAFTGGDSDNSYVKIALEISKNIRENVFSYAQKSLDSAAKKILSYEFKEIVKTNIVLAALVGGIGGEGCRACAAHAVNNGLLQIPYMRQFLHGEVVGFGNFVQLILDHKAEEFKRLKKLYKNIDLMDSFKYFNIKLSPQELDKVLDYACSKSETLRNMPRKVSKEELKDVLISLGV